ncbi:hypothetical protein SUDANB121_05713 [Nocardiopsis dassonvillei]|uniref:hypothetical protein n=1 Tax=Nocardiopsis dassonvillei TaxID=2014 RepID=UPI003F545B4B
MSVTLDPRRLPHHRPHDHERADTALPDRSGCSRQPVVLADALADVVTALSVLDPDLTPGPRLGGA